MKPLKLNRTTVRNLSNDELSGAAGGTLTTRPLPTLRCPITTGPSLPTLTTTRGSEIDACPSALGCTTTLTIFPTGRGGF
jgi:hypothetical protein